MFASIRDFWLKDITPEKRVKFFCGALLVGLVVALTVCTVNLFLHREYYPYVTFLFDPRYRFNDFYETIKIARGEQSGNYFPFFVWALQGLKYLPEKVSLYAMLAGGTALYFALARCAFSFLKQKWTAPLIFTLCSFPLLLALDRANTELLLFAVCSAFLLCYKAKRFWLATLLLALLFMPMNLPSHCFFASYFDLVLNLGSFLRPLIGVVLIVHLMKDFSFSRLLQGIKKYYGPKGK